MKVNVRHIAGGIEGRAACYGLRTCRCGRWRGGDRFAFQCRGVCCCTPLARAQPVAPALPPAHLISSVRRRRNVARPRQRRIKEMGVSPFCFVAARSFSRVARTRGPQMRERELTPRVGRCRGGPLGVRSTVLARGSCSEAFQMCRRVQCRGRCRGEGLRGALQMCWRVQ